mgnify:CR=1 FL=1
MNKIMNKDDLGSYYGEPSERAVLKQLDHIDKHCRAFIELSPFLVIGTMVFGGVMEAIGALKTISKTLLQWADTSFKLFASTVASCLALNVSASDQYLSIVVSGKMFEKAFKDKNLAPENLSRTLEDSATVTSALIPWNSCGAYHSSVLGVGVGEYFIYAVFNWISPFMTLIYAAFRIKIRTLGDKN